MSLPEDPLYFYDRLRKVPPEAQKKITGGRLSGMTDISPMWRIKTLTENFGPAGLGWWVEDATYEVLEAQNEVVVICHLKLRVRCGDEVSQPILGQGGSKLVAKEKNGLYVSDEAHKMAYTDALSVACKALGMGADVYWDKDSKYSQKPVSKAPTTPKALAPPPKGDTQAEKSFYSEPATNEQIKMLLAVLAQKESLEGKEEVLFFLSDQTGRSILATRDLTKGEASDILKKLTSASENKFEDVTF